MGIIIPSSTHLSNSSSISLFHSKRTFRQAKKMAPPICHLGYEWLETIPSSGLLLINEELRIAIGLRLGCDIVTPTTCVLCESHIDSLGHHPLHCRFSKGRLPRHYAINSIINRTLRSTNTPSTLEPTGDLRANENIGLTILQTIFAREHNRIADHLNKLNRQWSDETIYQETRKIIGAFIQHIQFNEFLPIIVGQDIMNDFGLTLNSCGYFAGYDSEIEATVHTEFSTAAYRFGHSLIPMQLNFLDDSFTPLAEPLLLRDAMLNPLLLYQFSDFNVFDSLLRSLIFDNAQKLDQIITGEVRNHLFELAKAKFGMDLPALNTMRGRDHGIPGYIQYRKACGLSPVNSFIDLVGVIPNSTIGVVRNLYRSVNDMDLFPLGLSEFPLKGAMLGPTFACILGIQFKALKFGDSFWYENIRPRRVFTRDQLKEIRKISLAKIICQNADDIPMIPRNIFLLVDSFRNPFIDCSRLASTDLSKWRVNDS
ncbi:peroxidasin homolog pxn-2-like [Gordionus sp. m RMFG-2023]|uniref:peroxidasin homolog pxn-2-like n=1 Tax=Gordionus sp. m RMFG-2023 TaxID=3053472 RepID=UPI0031FBF407